MGPADEYRSMVRSKSMSFAPVGSVRPTLEASLVRVEPAQGWRLARCPAPIRERSWTPNLGTDARRKAPSSHHRSTMSPKHSTFLYLQHRVALQPNSGEAIRHKKSEYLGNHGHHSDVMVFGRRLSTPLPSSLEASRIPPESPRTPIIDHGLMPG